MPQTWPYTSHNTMSLLVFTIFIVTPRPQKRVCIVEDTILHHKSDYNLAPSMFSFSRSQNIQNIFESLKYGQYILMFSRWSIIHTIPKRIGFINFPTAKLSSQTQMVSTKKKNAYTTLHLTLVRGFKETSVLIEKQSLKKYSSLYHLSHKKIIIISFQHN